ncbi:helix-turn-helix domain-containing protein [Streptomyces sp. SID5926]|nr:helix-turn-helix domain-containing protein [Streptomyces sp. SID5926]
MAMYRLRSDLLLKTASAHGDRSCYAIAKRTGIAESTLSRLRRGVAKPAAETLLVLSQAYGLSVDELIDRHPPADAREVESRATAQNDDAPGVEPGAPVGPVSTSTSQQK